MNVKLFTRDGKFVADVDVLPFEIMPEVILWGSRYFVRSIFFETGEYFGYQEAFCYAVTGLESAQEIKFGPIEPDQVEINAQVQAAAAAIKEMVDESYKNSKPPPGYLRSSDEYDGHGQRIGSGRGWGGGQGVSTLGMSSPLG